MSGLYEPIGVSTGDLRPSLVTKVEQKLDGDNWRLTMFHNNRIVICLMIATVGVALALEFGFGPFFLLVMAICPLMMFFTMRSMTADGHEASPRHS